MKIVYVSSEVFPYSKTGGLADIAHFLPKSLAYNNVDITVFTPYYASISKYHNKMSFLGRKTFYVSGTEVICNYYSLHENGVNIIFIQNMHYFERENFYGYHDDDMRFISFSYAVLEGLDLLQSFPEILHINDWQSAMIPFLLDNHYRKIKKYKNLHTLLTIHNLEYQGNFDKSSYKLFNEPFNYDYIHFDRVNYLKSGILKSTKVSTVSPQYRNEILTHQYGFGLDGVLNHRQSDLVGILNGIDDEVFNPNQDKFIVNYDLKSYQKGKLEAKKALYQEFNMGTDYDLPLIVYIGRYANQKGLWMIKDIAEEHVKNNKNKFFFLGSGDQNYANHFRYLTDKYPNLVGNYNGFNERLAHLLYAASDIFLMPSEFEPCGLGQMIAMKYGSLPIVRETGGLKDTVVPYNKYTNEGTGFSFKNLSSKEFNDQIYSALDIYHNNKIVWDILVKNAMKKDYSNQVMATKYINLYKDIIGG